MSWEQLHQVTCLFENKWKLSVWKRVWCQALKLWQLIIIIDNNNYYLPIIDNNWWLNASGLTYVLVTSSSILSCCLLVYNRRGVGVLLKEPGKSNFKCFQSLNFSIPVGTRFCILTQWNTILSSSPWVGIMLDRYNIK